MPSTPREPLLDLADPELEWKRFERFCLDLVSALPEVVRAYLYGTRGEAQAGIDIHADLIDGRVRTVQCRRVSRFDKTSATKIIAETTYRADEHEVWCTSPMTTGAREALDRAKGWSGLDIEQISSLVRGLPRNLSRWIVEDHLGSAARSKFLGPDGDLCVVPARWWYERSDRDGARLPTNQPIVGRDEELAHLRAALEDPEARVVLLIGRAGIGKTRLLRAIADAFSDEIAVLLLRDGIDARGRLGDEMPRAPFILLIDDADRRTDVAGALATALATGDVQTIVMVTRPQHVPALRQSIGAGGVASHAVREVSKIGPLTLKEGTQLAAFELGEKGPLSDRLGRWTRDLPALCVLGARLIRTDAFDPAHLSSREAAQNEILSRFRDELLGDVSPRADARLVRRLLEALAVLQPFDLDSDDSRRWLAELLESDAPAFTDAVHALEDTGLLVGGRRHRRVAPDLLGDFVVHEVCIRNGKPTGFAERILDVAPDWALPNALANLAQLDWRLSEAADRAVLEPFLVAFRRRLLRANAWDRAEGLRLLGEAAPYLAEWIVQVARDLLDHPAVEAEAAFGVTVTDADSKLALVLLLQRAALDLRVTRAAVALLWEIGCDRDLRPSFLLGEVDALKAAASFGNYELPLPYGEAVLDVAESLLADLSNTERFSALPLDLLEPMTHREGTRTNSRGYTIEITPFFVSARATKPLRTRLREVLVRACLMGGDRTRPTAAGLLGEMLRQPHGYFGKSAHHGAMRQWRDEQLQLLRDTQCVLSSTDDALVVVRLRDDVEWHAAHSAIRGVKTPARALLRAHPKTTSELLIRLLTSNFGRVHSEHEQRRYRSAARTVARELADPQELLDKIEDALDRLHRVDPDSPAAPHPLFSELAGFDPTWAIQTARILTDDQARPRAASGVGTLLSTALKHRPDESRAILGKIQAARDPAVRRLASDHVARLEWASDANAPERALAIDLAADEDPTIVENVILTAHGLARSDPALARMIVLSVVSVRAPRLAERLCMVLGHDLGLTRADENRVLELLLASPTIDHWQCRFLLRVARSRPRRMMQYLVARIDLRIDDYAYRPIPFEGFRDDPLNGNDSQRARILAELIATGSRYLNLVGMLELTTVFWSFAASSDEAFHALSDALASEDDAQKSSAAEIICGADPTSVLSRPEWVEQQLERADAGDLDTLESSLYNAFMMVSKSGTPGEPFPEDLALRDSAQAHAQASRPGSRAANFWTKMVKAAEREIHESLDQEEPDDDR